MEDLIKVRDTVTTYNTIQIVPKTLKGYRL